MQQMLSMPLAKIIKKFRKSCLKARNDFTQPNCVLCNALSIEFTVLSHSTSKINHFEVVQAPLSFLMKITAW